MRNQRELGLGPKRIWTGNIKEDLRKHGISRALLLAALAGELKAAIANDVVSKNITMVLENLLKNYESSQTPTHGKGLFDGLLLQAILAGHPTQLLRPYKEPKPKYKDVGEDLAAGHLLLQRQTLLRTHDNSPQQAAEDLSGRGYSVLHEVDNKSEMPNGITQFSHGSSIMSSNSWKLISFEVEIRPLPSALVYKDKTPRNAYPSRQLVYQWQSGKSVSFESGMALSQFDLLESPQRNLTLKRREGEFSLLQVNFNLRRHTGYFLIQVYVPCILIVVLSWVSFWIHREATSDRVGLRVHLCCGVRASAGIVHNLVVLTNPNLASQPGQEAEGEKGLEDNRWSHLKNRELSEKILMANCPTQQKPSITTVLTLSTIGLDSRTDLPKVRYATALDWFLLMSFFYCIATLLEFAGVHYFTKVGSGEIPMDEDEWEDVDEIEMIGPLDPPPLEVIHRGRRKSSLICPIYNDPALGNSPKRLSLTQGLASLGPKVQTSGNVMVERQTQTDTKVPRWKQIFYCLVGDETYRRERQREASRGHKRVNSVSYIDRAARVLFPTSFALLNVVYWLLYFRYQQQFHWKPPPSAL
ncbi:unnamed protein product [Nezara viridula]|uniref:Neurotransmitter-gated ion-channel transmembrane domain-containing protein n=1 Tax=Nezara viridula TaxID=85310 RepID=A0A9P0E4L9_NEZVI|nr:unnamed protein product [Nezara viridula]